MKRALSLLVALVATFAATAQVNTRSLTSEQPTDGETYYIVSDNGYYLTTKGTQVVTSTIAPKYPEWTTHVNPDGTWTISNGESSYLDWTPGSPALVLTGNKLQWTISDTAFRKGCLSIKADIMIEWDGTTFPDNDFIIVQANGNVSGYPSGWSLADTDADGYTQDMLFFATLPTEIDNRGEGGGDDKDEEIEVPENNIEGDFLANWKLGLQDAKVLTYIPMDSTLIHKGYWNPVRRGVTKTEMVLYNEDVVSMFYGNHAKNLYFRLPANGTKIRYFIADVNEYDKDHKTLWEHTDDYTKATNYILSKSNGIINDEYGKSLNLSLLRPTDVYYTPGEMRVIPCDYTFTSEHPNLLIGYEITYPGEYKENYKNGTNTNGGLLDGIWYSTTYQLPTERTYNALLKGDDDPDIYGGRYEDYTDHQRILLQQYRWCDNAALFCFVETEGEAGFPHRALKFEDVKVARCLTGERRLPVNFTFVNYGVDPIITATFDVVVGDNHTTLRYKDGIKFLAKATINENIEAPTQPMRGAMNILATKINGKDITEKVGIEGSIVAINKSENVKRMPVVEEATGAWCGWCPRGMVGMEKLRQTFGEDAALIAIHTGNDAKTNGMMDEMLATFNATAAPICVVQRQVVCDPYHGTIEGSRAGITYDAQEMSEQLTEASLNIDKVEINPTTGQIDLQTSVTFSIDCDEAPYTLTYVLTEDGLNYAQQMNYYVTQMSASDKETLKKTDPDLYALTQTGNPWRPTFNDIMVWSAPCMGIDGSIAGPIRRGEPITHTYSFNTTYTDYYGRSSNHVSNIRNCRLIALLLDKESLEVVQATQVRLTADEIDNTSIATPTLLQTEAPMFDLQGRMYVRKPQSSRASGLYIQQGRKYIVK